MLGPGATHRHAPFVGRSRDLALVNQLLDDGLAGSLRLVRVAGEAGSGRRRLLAELLHRGPDAEWVDLAPGGIEVDLPRWARTELPDLLDSYPDAAVPSWALHALARFEPTLARRAAVPARSREALPHGREPELLGAALGAIILALTARTCVVVHAGLWPEPGSPRERALAAASRAFREPGVVMTAAIDREHVTAPDPGGTRTLLLDPLRPEDMEDLAARWLPGVPAGAFGGWLHRATRGHALFAQEAVRWLEELGYLRVDDDASRLVLLRPVERLAIPIGMAAVLENRHAHLPLPARYLLHLVARGGGRLDVEDLRETWDADEEAFDEALAVLRRRDFLFRRELRRPVAIASPLWIPLAKAPSRRRLPRRKHATMEPIRPPGRPESPLAQAAHRAGVLEAFLRSVPDGVPVEEVARLLRSTRHRRGAAWEGVRGRLALFAAVVRRRQDRAAAALRWARRGRALLDAGSSPALRRNLGVVELRVLESLGRARDADALRAALADEARFAGHLVTAAFLDAAVAEARRRTGHLAEAESLARRAAAALDARGLDHAAAGARATRVRALVDMRRTDAARRAAEQDAAAHPEDESAAGLAEALGDSPGAWSFLRRGYALGAPSGLGFGLEDSRLDRDAAAAINAFFDPRDERQAAAGRARRLRTLEDELLEAGLPVPAADLAEVRLHHTAGGLPPEAIEQELARLARAHGGIDSPERLRDVANGLARIGAGRFVAFDAAFRASLLNPVPRDDEPFREPVRLHLFGRPRVERGARTWPRALGPAWWFELVTGVVARDLLGRGLDTAEAIGLLERAGDAPAIPLDRIVVLANDLLWERSGLPGGLGLRDDVLRWNWTGIACDARDVLAGFETADRLDANGDPAGATAARHRTLESIEGPLLPGADGEPVIGLRAAIGARIEAAVARETERSVGGGTFESVLEGAGRAAPGAARMLLDAVSGTSRLRRPAPHSAPSSPDPDSPAASP